MARILVVEDNPQNLKLVSVLLKSAGHEVAAAVDAGEAEEALARQLPDLILMDLGLPGKDGYSLTRELRERPSTAELPILAVTSFAMKGDEGRAREAGCTAYLTKPLDRVVFLKQVDELLANPGGPAARSGASPSTDGTALPAGRPPAAAVERPVAETGRPKRGSSTGRTPK
jgi:CheY-like chemotaxis protein